MLTKDIIFQKKIPNNRKQELILFSDRDLRVFEIDKANLVCEKRHKIISTVASLLDSTKHDFASIPYKRIKRESFQRWKKFQH